MNRKSIKILGSVVFVSLILNTALSNNQVKALNWTPIYTTRISGTTRYETASKVATNNWKSGSDNVVLVSGESYADAVSASALAKKLDAPILLTTPNTLSKDAQDAITTLKAKNIYIIGGTASIAQNIREELKSNYTVIELGGATRYETNRKVADKLIKLGVDPSKVLVVSGEGFSDAISAASVAAANGQILLLASNNENSIKTIIDFIKENKSKATVIGTCNVINDNIYNLLGATVRVDGGCDRFDTNLKILKEFEGSFNYYKIYVANASPANPDNLYADALVASAVSGKYSAPLVLVDEYGKKSTSNALEYMKSNAIQEKVNNTKYQPYFSIVTKTSIQLIGGTGAVPELLEDLIDKAVTPNSL